MTAATETPEEDRAAGEAPEGQQPAGEAPQARGAANTGPNTTSPKAAQRPTEAATTASTEGANVAAVEVSGRLPVATRRDVRRAAVGLVRVEGRAFGAVLVLNALAAGRGWPGPGCSGGSSTGCGPGPVSRPWTGWR